MSMLVDTKTTKQRKISRSGSDMKTQTETLLSEAIDLVNGVDHVLANTMTQYDVSAKDCYNLAEKLERACHLLLVIGDRKTQEDLNRIPINEGVPF